MVKRLTIALLASACMSACSYDGPPIMTRTFSVVLSTSHEFSIPPEQVKSTILKGLQTTAERDDPFYRRHGFRPGDLRVLSVPGTPLVPFIAEDQDSALEIGLGEGLDVWPALAARRRRERRA